MAKETDDAVMQDANGIDEKKQDTANAKKEKNKAADKPELSEEDLELKANLEMIVERIGDSDTAIQSSALDNLSREIRSATTSMTSVPKPLKFLRPHFSGLKDSYGKLSDESNRKKLADIISVLAITTGKEGERESLKYRLLGNQEEVEKWGHEYLRNLAGEIGDEYQHRRESNETFADLLELVAQIAPYHMKHNSEPEAVDLLLEVEQLDWLLDYTDEKNYSRTCLYLISCCRYLAEPDDMRVLESTYNIYCKVGRFSDALRIAIKMKKYDLVEEIFAKETDTIAKKQLAYILGQNVVRLSFEEGKAAVSDASLRQELETMNGNVQLPQQYLDLARDLDVMEPKLPDDVYKSHLVERTSTSAAVDSARQNMASSFVNGFVNAGFGNDKLVTVDVSEQESQVHWIFKNKDQGKTAAVASIGLISLWDIDGGLPLIDKYMYSRDPHVQGGAALAVGMICTRINHENDPAFALLFETVENAQQTVRLPSILGLGLAYADSNKQELEDYLSPLLQEQSDTETCAMIALALGMIFVGTAKDSVAETLLQYLITKSELDLSSPFERFLPLALGLVFLGQQGAVEATLEVIKAFSPKIQEYCSVTVESMAYAGTGDVLMVQKMMGIAGQHIEFAEGEDWKAAHVGAAVIGLALISMGEDVGAHMVLRTLEHILQYGEVPARKAVPLALALLNISNPDMNVMDTLSRLSHESSQTVAMNAVLALGLIGAGTNNARLAGLLRNLSSYYYKEPSLLFLVKLAQGLVHMGKGLLTLSPTQSDNFLLSGCALAGILPVMHASLDMWRTICGKHPFLIYSLASAMRPRMLMTMDTEGKLLPVSVRVGQAVDTVAQAGRPKTITGFQTHTTPVLLSAGERAELATEKYLPLTSVLEGVVILKPNPDYVEVAE